MRPRLLDLFCGAGGCTKGYQRAGFYVVGVDINAQPNYCGDEFHQADALEFLRDWPYPLWANSFFDAIHASPPCQRYSHALKTGGDRSVHPDLIAPTRGALKATGLPYVIENVEGARRELVNPVLLCGSMFGLHVRRHRLFECSFNVLTAKCVHDVELQRPQVYVSTTTRDGTRPLRGIVNAHATGATWNTRQLGEAMEMTWADARGTREAIPPAYTELIGHQLITTLEEKCG